MRVRSPSRPAEVHVPSLPRRVPLRHKARVTMSVSETPFPGDSEEVMHIRECDALRSRVKNDHCGPQYDPCCAVIAIAQSSLLRSRYCAVVIAQPLLAIRCCAAAIAQPSLPSLYCAAFIAQSLLHVVVAQPSLRDPCGLKASAREICMSALSAIL